MKISGGLYKGRKLFVPEGLDVRPTSDRMRQTIFNILHHASWSGNFDLQGAKVLDIFCGSGALGLEALSHGAVHATFVDMDITSVTKNTAFLDKSYYKIIRSNALSVSQGNSDINLVFMDPPYRKNLIEPCVAKVMDSGWLSERAIFVIEAEKNIKLNLDLELLDSRKQSQSEIYFFGYNATIK